MKSGRLVSALRTVNKKTINNRRVRRFGITAYSEALRANVFLPGPRVFLNGPSKSGTHLLSDCVALMPRMMFSGRHFAVIHDAPEIKRPARAFALPKEEKELGRFLGRSRKGMFVTAHAAHDQWLAEELDRLGFKHVLLLRDPRDVVVSRAFFRKREAWHVHHRYFQEVLTTDPDRIMATIVGFSASDVSPVPLPSIGDSFRSYLPWLESDSVLTVRFEDLLGPAGGGDADTQRETVQRIAEYIDRPLDMAAASSIADRLYAPKGITFRRGVAGDWRNHFTDEHREAFAEVAGDLLSTLGYDTDR